MSVESLITTYGLTVSVKRPTETVETSGFPTPSYVTSSTEKLFVQPRSGIETLKYGREIEEKAVVLYALVGTDIVPSDRLTIASGGGVRVFDVQTVRDPGEFSAATSVGHMVIEAFEISGETIPGGGFGPGFDEGFD